MERQLERIVNTVLDKVAARLLGQPQPPDPGPEAPGPPAPIRGRRDRSRAPPPPPPPPTEVERQRDGLQRQVQELERANTKLAEELRVLRAAVAG